MKVTIQALIFCCVLVTSAISRSETSFTYEDLTNLIQKNKLTSVEAVLPLLPTNMLSNFTLVYNSLSLQKADYFFPRVIMFGTDATLTCTFNGGIQELEGSDTIECYQFRSVTNTFDFREIQFPTTENKLRKVLFSQSNQRASGGTKCTSCHAENPRPNWESYSVWPGVYGSHDDSYSEALFKGAGAAKLKEEVERLTVFNGIAAYNSRYKNLIFTSNSEYAPYSNQFKPPTNENRPNERFLLALTTLVVKRNVKMLVNFPLNEQLNYIKAAARCDDDLKVKDALEKNFKEIEWVPSFRPFNGTCDDCSTNRKPYEYSDGLTEFNLYIAYNLTEKMVKEGRLPKEILKIATYDAHYPYRDQKGYQKQMAINPIDPTIKSFCMMLSRAK